MPVVLFIPPADQNHDFVSVDAVATATRTTLSRVAQVLELGPHPVGQPSAFLRELAIVRERVDVVFDMTGSGCTGLAAPEVPVLYWALGSLPHGGSGLASRRRYLKTSDEILVNCRADAEIFERILGGSGPAARHLPFAVDTERLCPTSDAARISTRARYGLPGSGTIALYAGRVNFQKNLHHAVDLIAACGLPDLHLVIAGQPDRTRLKELGLNNEGYGEALTAHIRRNGLEGRVHQLGHLDAAALGELFPAADLFISLSTHHDENFGFAPVEAMAAGLPTIVSDWGGYRDTTLDGVTGFRLPTLLSTRGPRVLWRRGVTALTALARSPGLRLRLGGAGRERAVAEFSRVRFEERVGAAIRDARARRGQPAIHGDRSFRFHPMARRAHARNALMHLARERHGTPVDVAYGVGDYDLYRFFLAPYATVDGCDLKARAEDRPLPILGLAETAAGIVTTDPVWRLEIGLSRSARGALARLDGVATLGEAAAALGAPPESLLAEMTTLARAGIIDLGRELPCPGEPTAT